MKYTPEPYQRYGRQFLLDNPEVAEFIDMGLGKTVMTATAIDDLIAGCDINSALVVCPPRVMHDVWPPECRKWDHLKNLKIIKLDGSPQQRLKALREPADIYIISYHLLIWLSEVLEKFKPHFDMLVLDESSMMKNQASRRFKRFRRHLHIFKRRVIMTGTPTPNGYADLYAQLFMVDRGARLGKTYTDFRDRFFNWNPYSYELKIKEGAEERIQGLIKDITLCLRSEDYLKLPPVITNDIKVTLPPKAMQLYKKFEKDMVVELSKLKTLEAFNAAAVSVKCRQITSGSVYTTDDGGVRSTNFIHDAKMEALEDIIEEANGQSVMVAYEFKSEIERLLKWRKAPWIGGGSKNASQVIKDWNAGKLPLMYVYPGSMGHGVNLQFGGRIIAWTSMTWNLDFYQQLIKRLHRRGQKGSSVIVHRLIARDTVDELVAETLAGKHEGQAGLIKALRSLGAPKTLGKAA